MKNIPANSTSSPTRGVLRWAGQMLAMLIIFGLILFLAAGRLNWIGGWAFWGLNLVTQALSGIILIPLRPDMLVERSSSHENTKPWDRILAPLVSIVSPLVILVTAALDARFHWTQSLPTAVWIGSLVIAFICQIFVIWAMATNAFFATTVRIQSDRDQGVVSSGPYSLVRHPGYAGSVWFDLMLPLMLGSWWAYIPAILSLILIFVRTGLEDRTLQAELAGYRDYTQKVHYRLIPGIF